ncbi:MAG TPA: glycosyltransferase family 39 protein [Candidatus Sulfotelmatobacter sp.]|nr:glycosyltransferase family 39 protein [Candidatus Sulfotelmatobacter sp.]
MIVLAVALCFASGYFLVALLWPDRTWKSDLLLRSSLSVGLGIGLFSLLFFLARAFNSDRLTLIDVLSTSAFGLLLLISRRRPNPTLTMQPPREALEFPHWPRRLLQISFALAVAVAGYCAILRVIVHPYGDGWDAFSIWNLHARFMFRGGSHWRDGFTNIISWSHPDYPLLLPASVAHFWTYLGDDNTAVPAVISLLFAASTLGLLCSSLNGLRGRNIALLAGVSLLCTPFFVEQAAAQYADVPLSFFFLATVVLFCIHHQRYPDSNRLLVLSGIAGGFAAWTKNEGLLFLCVALSVGVVFAGIRKREGGSNAASRASGFSRWPALALFSVGAIPILVLILWFKHSIAPPGDLFSTPASMLGKLMTPGRYWTVFRWYVRQVFRFGHWWIAPGTALFALLYFAYRQKNEDHRNPAFWPIFSTLTLTAAGYFVIYLITPYDIYWHLRFSLNRLFLQLWPSVIFLFFSSVSFRSLHNVSK